MIRDGARRAPGCRGVGICAPCSTRCFVRPPPPPPSPPPPSLSTLRGGVGVVSGGRLSVHSSFPPARPASPSQCPRRAACTEHIAHPAEGRDLLIARVVGGDGQGSRPFGACPNPRPGATSSLLLASPGCTVSGGVFSSRTSPSKLLVRKKHPRWKTPRAHALVSCLGWSAHSCCRWL